jgi:hypothetical protein
MILNSEKEKRTLKNIEIETDLVVIGGGLAGTCCALTAARKGIKVVLVQDRPVLGGNASSEVRLWALGATSHMGNNNRWAREGGILNELAVENLYRNPDGNPIIFDTILLEKVWEEKNIQLLLNTAVYETQKKDAQNISNVLAFCSQNSTHYNIKGQLFCDASGDGIVGFQAGAAFRMGAESKEEFNEPFAPSKEYGELLGHSIYFMSKDVGKPVPYIPPAYALKDITKIPRYRNFTIKDQACSMWWIEYGGRLDTIHDSETIKWELWKVVYGVWDYIKNSGNFPEAENLTLEWVGHIPGKRESRRFEGHYMLTQNDIVQQKHFYDSVSFGGWAIDIHPADGVFSELPGCSQWHSKGVYEIPYRCMMSKNIDNLFLAGRIISATHLAFGSTRVMMTCAHSGQAVGMAAALSILNNCKPAEWLKEDKISHLQQALLETGQYIPHVSLNLPKDYALKASSELHLSEIPFDGNWMPLQFSTAQLLPLDKGAIPCFELKVNATKATTLKLSLRKSSKIFNYTPDQIIGEKTIQLAEGVQWLQLDFDAQLETAQYAFLCLHENEEVQVLGSLSRITGLVSVFNKHNKAVSNYGKQEPAPSIGFESFEFWTPERRPLGHNLAMKISPAIKAFNTNNLVNGFDRPTTQPNAWVAAQEAAEAALQIEWKASKKVQKILLSFDPDWDHPLESSIWGHPERVIPFVVRDYKILDENQNLIYSKEGNYQARNEIILEKPIQSKKLIFQFKRPAPNTPIAVFSIQIS